MIVPNVGFIRRVMNSPVKLRRASPSGHGRRRTCVRPRYPHDIPPIDPKISSPPPTATLLKVSWAQEALALLMLMQVASRYQEALALLVTTLESVLMIVAMSGHMVIWQTPCRP